MYFNRIYNRTINLIKESNTICKYRQKYKLPKYLKYIKLRKVIK